MDRFGPPTDVGKTPSLLAMLNISKSFGGSHALDGVSVQIEAGSVHALCGANGAGKSTLVKILAGLERADHGDIRLDGNRIEIHNPRQAADHGLSFIHQELNLVPKFTVLQNMAMGSARPGRWGTLDLRRLRREARSVQERLGRVIPLDEEIGKLSVSDRWMVSLGRSLMRPASFIAMDEPTASFTDDEVDRLMTVIDELTSSGVGILYVSHRLDEVLEVAEKITVLRSGRYVTTLDAGRTSRAELTHHIVGRDVDAPTPRSGAAQLADQRKVRFSAAGLGRAPRVVDVSFDVYQGEILGFAGLVGSGRTELARLLVGADRATAGSMTLSGEPYRPRSPHEALRAGVALVPEERRSQGLVLTDSVEGNLAMAEHGAASRMLRIHRPRLSRVVAQGIVEQFGIRALSVRQSVHSLSGGNQQKVVLGKYIRTGPDMLVLDEPTVGVDVGARAEIYQIITDLSRTGTSVVMISSDFEELAICDRVLVMRDGLIVAEVSSAEFNKAHLTTLSFGTHRKDGA
jgi:ribose transport system ATP-binding protein